MNKLILVAVTLWGFASFQADCQTIDQKLQDIHNLKLVKEQAEEFFREENERTNQEVVDNEHHEFMRDYWYWKSRVAPDGGLPDLLSKHQAYMQAQKQAYVPKKSRAASWKNISQTTTTSGYSGMGRVAAIAFHPTDTNIIYLGTERGGIWKTTVGGNNWTPLGDQLPFCSVGNIVVDFQNPNTLYITIGANEGWWHYGLGVYKSIDGGQTWAATANTCNFTNAVVYYKLMMAPNNNQILYSSQSNGLYKSVDAGATWTQINSASFIDFEFKYGNPSTMFFAKTGSSTTNEIIKTTDGGSTFTTITNFNTAGCSLEIGLTPADTNYIGVGFESGTGKKFYLSTNGGSTFTLKSSSLNDNAIIQFSALDKNKIYAGYVSNYRSTDGGANWDQITNWYNNGVLPTVHADNHFSGINPLNTKNIYFCNDGGLYRYNEVTDTWKDLSQGLIVTQFYKISSSQQDSLFMIGGTQDNGGRKRTGLTTWAATNGGDAMEVAVNPDLDETIFTTYCYGQLYRSYDKWDQDTYHDITPDTNGGAWVTPYMLEPKTPYHVYAGYKGVWRSDDQGDTWTQLGSNLTSSTDKLEYMDIAPSNINYIYAGRGGTIFYTPNQGQNWYTKTVPSKGGAFEQNSCVAVHPRNENLLYVTRSGYGNHGKVYRSLDNGTTWTNLSYNIPNIPVNCILIDSLSNAQNYDLYIGTDIGVYYMKENDTTWQYYGTGLPNTEVSDLDIFYLTGKLRAGTYGRGIWETALVRPVYPASVDETSVIGSNIQLNHNPVEDQLSMTIVWGRFEQGELEIYDMSSRLIRKEKVKLEPGNNTFCLDVSMLSTGTYILNLNQTHQRKESITWIKQ